MVVVKEFGLFGSILKSFQPPLSIIFEVSLRSSHLRLERVFLGVYVGHIIGKETLVFEIIIVC